MLRDRVASLPCPTVALLQGFALGGGMELALACRYRVGVDDGRLALGLHSHLTRKDGGRAKGDRLHRPQRLAIHFCAARRAAIRRWKSSSSR